MNDYCERGVYASDFGDIIGNAFCQIYDLKCKVAHLNADGSDLEWLLLVPLRQRVTTSQKIIQMVRYHNHYDGLKDIVYQVHSGSDSESEKETSPTPASRRF